MMPNHYQVFSVALHLVCSHDEEADVADVVLLSEWYDSYVLMVVRRRGNQATSSASPSTWSGASVSLLGQSSYSCAWRALSHQQPIDGETAVGRAWLDGQAYNNGIPLFLSATMIKSSEPRISIHATLSTLHRTTPLPPGTHHVGLANN